MSEDIRNVPKVKQVNPTWLRDLIWIFTMLDEERQDEATSALNAILQEQMRGEKHE